MEGKKVHNKLRDKVEVGVPQINEEPNITKLKDITDDELVYLVYNETDDYTRSLLVDEINWRIYEEAIPTTKALEEMERRQN